MALTEELPLDWEDRFSQLGADDEEEGNNVQGPRAQAATAKNKRRRVEMFANEKLCGYCGDSCNAVDPGALLKNEENLPEEMLPRLTWQCYYETGEPKA
jgi:hypothetical protein